MNISLFVFEESISEQKVKIKMAAKEANPTQLIIEVAGLMKKEGMVNPPQWSQFVKTGAHTERTPDDPDWWYVRAASVLRQVYMRGPIGVGKLRNWYGGRKNRGAKPEQHYPAGGKIIRVCLQQLEGAGLINKEGVGRKLTPKGQSLLDKAAASIKPREEKPVKKKVEKKTAKKPKKEAKPKAEKKLKVEKKEEKPKAEKRKASPKKEEKPKVEVEPKKEEKEAEPKEDVPVSAEETK